jgi:hypothetical protein
MRPVDAALQYAEIGWFAFPCKLDKTPYVSGGFKAASLDSEQIRAWWKRWPEASIGIATGRSRVAVLDVDPRHSGDETFSRLSERLGSSTFETVQSRTGGGGSHFIFRCPPDIAIKGGVSVFGEGIDVRADGGYIIVPPSRHPSGNSYEWQANSDPFSRALLLWPASLEQFRATRPQFQADNASACVHEGARNNFLTRKAGTLRRLGVDSSAMFVALQQLNVSRCEPPLESAEVEKIAASVARYSSGEADSVSSLSLVTLSDVEAEETYWLWKDRIPCGKVTLLVGDPGDGKSYVSLGIAAALSTGSCLPGGSDGECRDVILWNGEDGIADTIKRRVEQCGADATRLHAIEGARDTMGRIRPFGLDCVDSLKQEIALRPNVRFVILDPVAALLKGVDAHKDNEVRVSLQPLVDLAQEHDVAIMAIMHLRKADAQRALYRVGGSIGFVGLARSVLLVATSADGRRAIIPIKNNLSALPCPVTFQIDENGFRWEGEAPDLDVDSFTARNGVGQSKVSEAIAFLKEALSNGPCFQRDIESSAQEKGIAARTLRRAAEALRLKKRRIGFGSAGRWSWSLPQAQTLRVNPSGSVILGLRAAALVNGIPWPERFTLQ